MRQPVRLLLIDDHKIVLEGLKSTFELEDDFTVVGLATDGLEALRLFSRLRPDVVLLDLMLKGESGVDICKSLLENDPEANVVILTTFLDEDKLFQCIIAGARGYVIKDVEPDELKKIIRGVAEGQSILDPQITSPVMQRLRRQEVERSKEAMLSPRRIEVLQLLAEGLTNKEIGRMLYLSESTIKYHVHQAMQVFGVQRRAELVREVMRSGIVK
jgi:two-component system, NarL family, response regulator DevR